MPPRLLQGLLPSVLLEAFQFWQGDDGRLRAALPSGSGDKFDQWFGYRVEVELINETPSTNATSSSSTSSAATADGEQHWVARVVRKPTTARVTPIASKAESRVQAQQLRRDPVRTNLCF